MTNATIESTQQLRKRLFFFFALALLMLTLSLTASIYITLFDQLKKAENSSLTHFAELRSIAVSEWCRRVKDIANQITSRTRIREELEKYNKQLINLEKLIKFTRPKLQDAMNLSSEIVGIVRLDINNRIITGCGSEPTFSQSEVSKFIFNNTVLFGPLNIENRSLIIVSAPILNRDNERQGTDLVIIDTFLLKNIVADPEKTDKTSKIIAGCLSKNEISPLFPVQYQNDSYFGKKDLSEIKDFMAMAIEGKNGLGHAADLIVAYHTVEESDWGLVITMNQNELYSPIYQKLTIIGFLSLAIYIIILTAFWFLLKPLAGRILMHANDLEKKIQEKTEILEEEIVARKKTELEKENIIVELKEAILEIKTLSGMLPICANCKKIRDDKGYWNQIESYIREHSEAEFSHSLCPDCAKTLYPDLKLYNDDGE